MKAEVITFDPFYITVPDGKKFAQKLKELCQAECVKDTDWLFNFDVKEEIEIETGE